jgi:hypothetical protein
VVVVVHGEGDMAVHDARSRHGDRLEVAGAGAGAALASSSSESVHERMHWVRCCRLGWVTGADDCGVWRIGTAKVVGRRGKGRGRNCGRIVLVHPTRNVEIVKANVLRIVVEHVSIKLVAVVISSREHFVAVFVSLDVGFHFFCR